MEKEQVAKLDKVEKTDAEWRAELTPEQYYVMRQKGTEPAFSGALYRNHADGTYRCAACGAELFSSDTKFESGTRLAQLYRAGQRGSGESARGQELRDDAHGSHLRTLRRPPGACLPGWPGARRAPLLHQFFVAGF